MRAITSEQAFKKTSMLQWWQIFTDLFHYNEITEGYNQVINVINLNYLTSGSTIQLDEVNLEIFRQFKIL